MKKTLVGKVKRGIKKGILLGTVLLGLGNAVACQYPYFIPEPTPTTESKNPNPKSSPTAEPNYVDISGQVTNNETGLGCWEGTVEAYGSRTQDSNGDYTYNDFLGETTTDNSGNFSMTLDKIVNSGENIYIRANAGNISNPTSYIKTIKISAEDTGSISLGVAPFESDFDNDGYFDLDKNKDGTISLQEKRDFREHYGRTNSWSTPEKYELGIEGVVNGNPYAGNKKWNKGELENTLNHPIFQGYKIDTTGFSAEELDNFENAIHTSKYPGASGLQIIRESNPLPSPGWITVYHTEQGEGPHTNLWDKKGEDGYIEHAEVYLNTTALSISRHEGIYHGLMACSGHPDANGVSALFESVGGYLAPYDDLTAIDVKENYVIEKNPGMSNEKTNLEL